MSFSKTTPKPRDARVPEGQLAGGAIDRSYIDLPSAVAQAMDFSKGETVQWIIHDKAHPVLARPEAPPNPSVPLVAS